MTEGDRLTLLIVDDEEDVLLSLRSMFRREFHVITVPRARDAFTLIENESVQIVISDQRMPDMNGVEFLEQVSRQFPDVIRLMITGYADINSVISAVNQGHVFRYIAKPWDPAELQAAVRQAAEQYRVLAERRRLLHELDEANQLKTAFITIASHELNTPLTIVLGMLQLAAIRSKDDVVRNCLDRATRAAQRLQHLLTNTFKLLQQSEFHRSLERTNIPLADLFREIREDLDPYLSERQQSWVERITPADASIMASRTHLRDVLENLLTNAIKFSNDGSPIMLVADQSNERTLFRVVDQGVGIPLEDQPHVFEPFFSTWDTLHHSTGSYGFCKRGLGIGLAIVRKFVEMHGGTIDFNSSADQGTEFIIDLPNRPASESKSGRPTRTEVNR
ncbi:hybrid sensor histidine kinase/response regulator [bacterium]|nr:hybrid sensor histidine kinase/response regulator [bacterium]